MPGLSHLGFSAWISIDGEAQPTYQIQQDGNTCTGWIPSTAGRPFSVAWKDESRARIATSGHIFIDGRDVASAIMRPGRTRPVERIGAKISSRKVKPFKFSVLALTDDDALVDQFDPHLRDMGTVKVEITRVKLGPEVAFKGYEAQEPGVVHERAKKTGAHCTSFGASKRSSTKTVAITRAPYDEDHLGPYVTFVFKYRSADLLKAQGIIPNGTNVEGRHHCDEIITISDSDEERPAKKQRRSGSDDFTLRSSSVTSLVDEVEVGENHDLDDLQESQTVEGVYNFGTPSLLQSPGEDDNQIESDHENDELRIETGGVGPSEREESQLQEITTQYDEPKNGGTVLVDDT